MVVEEQLLETRSVVSNIIVVSSSLGSDLYSGPEHRDSAHLRGK